MPLHHSIVDCCGLLKSRASFSLTKYSCLVSGNWFSVSFVRFRQRSRSRKKIRIVCFSFSVSPHGNRCVNSMPLSGVLVGVKRIDQSRSNDSRLSTWDFSRQIIRKPLEEDVIFPKKRSPLQLTFKLWYSCSNMSKNISSVLREQQKTDRSFIRSFISVREESVGLSWNVAHFELSSQKESRLLSGLFNASQMKVVDVGATSDDADALGEFDCKLESGQSHLELYLEK